MAQKKPGAATVPAEQPDYGIITSEDELLDQSEDLRDVDHGLEGELDDVVYDGEDFGNEEVDEDGDEDADDDNNHAQLKEAARRQVPAGPGPMSLAAAAAAGKNGGMTVDAALLLQTETSDAVILQLEVDELLRETRVSYSKGSSIAAVVSRLKEALLSMPEHQVPLSIAKGFIESLGGSAKDSLTIQPPAAVTIVGSYATRAVARPDTTVDIAVQLPAGLLVPKAHLNHRYHVIRVVYLLAVAQHLRDVSYSLFGDQHIEALHGDPTRPALLLQPPKAEGFCLRLMPSIVQSTFALPRLAPDRNGVRAHCKASSGKAVATATASEHTNGKEGTANASQQQTQNLLPTPHYNAGILEDMLLPIHAARIKSILSTSPSLLDGLLLLKIWARRHGLMISRQRPDGSALKPAWLSTTTCFAASACGCLDGCILTMLVLLLAEKNKMASSTSALQVFRAALQLLADGPAWSKGLALSRQTEDLGGTLRMAPPPLMQVFKANFDVVFLEFTGWLNVAANMTRGALAHAQLLARRTLELLTAPSDPYEAFAAALLTTSNPAAAFDYHWRITLPAGTTWPAVKTGTVRSDEPEQTDMNASDVLCRNQVLWRQQEALIENIVRQALSDRAVLVRILRRPLSPALLPDALALGLVPLAEAAGTIEMEEVEEEAVAGSATAMPSSVWVGAVMHPVGASRLVDVGPAADESSAAAKFRRFWGEKAELRRWQDGKITEAVAWDVTPHTRHVIPDLILQHVARRHLPPGSEVSGAADCLDWALSSRTSTPGDDLTASRAAEAAVDQLAKQLRALDNLALKVVGVQPLSLVARGTAPVPPQPHPLAGGALTVAAGEAAGSASVPRCLEPLELLVTLENSGSWPDDPEAFRKMKVALGLQLANTLTSSYGHHVITSEEAVDVLFKGFAFRLILYSGRDEAMQARTATGSAASASGTATMAVSGGAFAPTPTLGSGQLSPEESPLLLSWHCGLVSLVSGSNSVFAPAARLAGRWVAAHMMTNHVSPQSIELLVAAAFAGAGSPAAPPPGSRLTGFLRFLQLLSRWPWHLKPLVVDPARELNEANRRAIITRFEARKTSGDAPAMYICTPRDRESRHWTSKGPNTATLQRLIFLAARSSALLQLLLQPPSVQMHRATTGCRLDALTGPTPSGLPSAWQGVFATPASDFDAFLLLRKEALPQADKAITLPSHPLKGYRDHRNERANSLSLSSVLLKPGTAVHELIYGGGVGNGGEQELDMPASGPDTLSAVLEDAGPLQPPPKRGRAFLRSFPEKLVKAKGVARLQSELLIGLDPVAQLVSELTAHYGHLATFCVDGLGGRVVGVRWRPDAFLPQPLRLNTAHTALPLALITKQVRKEDKAIGKKRAVDDGGDMTLCVANMFVVMREVKELGLGLVEDWLMPASYIKATASW